MSGRIVTPDAFFARLVESFVQLLPPAIVRVALLLTVAGALFLHLLASFRIERLETEMARMKVETQASMAEVKAETKAMGSRLEELVTEIRSYRQDIREENKALKAAAKTVPPAQAASQ